MYIIDMKEVILMIYIILTIIAVLLSTLIMGVANKHTNKKIHDIDHELNIHWNSPITKRRQLLWLSSFHLNSFIFVMNTFYYTIEIIVRYYDITY